MFANSVISRSSISISSLLLSSPIPPSFSFSFTRFLLAIFSPCLCPADSFLPLVWFCASSECNLRASRRYALSRHIRPLRDRSLSFFLPLFLSAVRPSVRPSLSLPLSLSRLLSLHLSFILPCGSNVSVSNTLLHQPVERIRVHRSKYLPLAPSFSLLLQLFCRTSPLRRTNLRSLLIPYLLPSKYLGII